MRFSLLVSLTLLLFIPLNAGATYISLSSTTDTERIVNATSTEVNITVTNLGDEPAYDLIVDPIYSRGLTGEQVSLGNINPNQTSAGTIKLSIPANAAPGRYSMGLLIRYNDQNDYPFSFVTLVKFFYKTPVQANVVGLLDEVTLPVTGRETMHLKIQNRDDKPHEAVVHLYTPNQIAVVEKEKTITLAPSSETTVDFVVSSVGALPGANYFVFATIDYDENGNHYSVISSEGRILTTAGGSSIANLCCLGIAGPMLITILIALGILLLGV